MSARGVEQQRPLMISTVSHLEIQSVERLTADVVDRLIVDYA